MGQMQTDSLKNPPFPLACAGPRAYHTSAACWQEGAQAPKLSCDNCGEALGGAKAQQHTPGCGASFKNAAK